MGFRISECWDVRGFVWGGSSSLSFPAGKAHEMAVCLPRVSNLCQKQLEIPGQPQYHHQLSR